MSKLLLSVMGAFAEFERSLLKERQREGIALGCIDILSEPSPGTGDGDSGLEVLFEFVEAGGQAAELLEMGEGAFDAVALAVEDAVEAALDGAM